MNRLGFSQGHELQPYDATAVAITPGWLRSLLEERSRARMSQPSGTRGTCSRPRFMACRCSRETVYRGRTDTSQSRDKGRGEIMSVSKHAFVESARGV